MIRKLLPFIIGSTVVGTCLADGGDWHTFPSDKYVQGSCEDFNKYLREKGTMGHANWAGATKLQVSHHIPYEVRQTKATEFCGTADVSNFPFVSSIETRVLYWASENKLSSACQAHYKEWRKTVDQHEVKHRSDIDALMGRAQTSWKAKTFKQCTGTSQLAEDQIEGKIKQLAESEGAKLVGEAERLGEAFHATGAGGAIRPLDCAICK